MFGKLVWVNKFKYTQINDRCYTFEFCLVDSTIIKPPPPECPQGYTLFFSSCFRLYLDPLIHDDAQKVCEKDSPVDSFLATTDVGYENAVLEYLMYREGVETAWIGLLKNLGLVSITGPSRVPVVFDYQQTFQKTWSLCWLHWNIEYDATFSCRWSETCCGFGHKNNYRLSIFASSVVLQKIMWLFGLFQLNFNSV